MDWMGNERAREESRKRQVWDGFDEVLGQSEEEQTSREETTTWVLGP
jgi:hypothetical protein